MTKQFIKLHYFQDCTIYLLFWKSQQKNLSQGVPQKSSCGLGLWNLATVNIFKVPFPMSVNITCFTDDYLLTVIGKINKAERKAGRVLTLLTEWSIKNKLTFLIQRKSKRFFSLERKNSIIQTSYSWMENWNSVFKSNIWDTL